MNKRRNIFGLLFVALVVIGAIAYTLSSQNRFNGIVFDPPEPTPDFTLDSAQGPVSLSDFHGKVVVLFFGYTSCPDVCPLTLSYLRRTMSNLGDQAQGVQVIFVSVDGMRDTPEKLAIYTANFNPDFIGLTGTQAQIDQVTKDFRIFYQMNPPDSDGFYSVDHTASIIVLDQQGRQVLIWPHNTQPDQMASDLDMLLNE